MQTLNEQFEELMNQFEGKKDMEDGTIEALRAVFFIGAVSTLHSLGSVVIQSPNFIRVMAELEGHRHNSKAVLARLREQRADPVRGGKSGA